MLGIEKAISNIQIKLSLLNFSLTHCPPEDITDILEERKALEIQVCVCVCFQYDCFVAFLLCVYCTQVHDFVLFYTLQALYAKCATQKPPSVVSQSEPSSGPRESMGSGVQNLVGRSMQQIVSKGAGAMQLITKRCNM